MVLTLIKIIYLQKCNILKSKMELLFTYLLNVICHQSNISFAYLKVFSFFLSFINVVNFLNCYSWIDAKNIASV